MDEHASTATVDAPAEPIRPSAATRCTILHGDAFDLFGCLKTSSVDLLITSPPYWGHRDYGLDHNWELFNDIPKVRKIGPKTPGYDWYRREGGLLGLEPYPEWFIQHLAEILDKARTSLKGPKTRSTGLLSTSGGRNGTL